MSQPLCILRCEFMPFLLKTQLLKTPLGFLQDLREKLLVLDEELQGVHRPFFFHAHEEVDERDLDQGGILLGQGMNQSLPDIGLIPEEIEGIHGGQPDIDVGIR